MKRYNYKCVIMNTGGDMVVHHLHKGFTEILKESLVILKIPLKRTIGDYGSEELKSIGALCVELHKKYGLGIPLKTNIHKEFHSLYGAGNNTLDQFKEFALLKYNANINFEL